MFIKKEYVVITGALILFVILISILGATSVFALESKEKVFITFPTATVGGSYYAAGTVIASLWNDKLKEDNNLYVTAQSSKGSIENIQMLKNKEAELAILNSSVYIPAFLGVDKFENNSFKDLRFITMLWANPMQMVVTEKSGINELSDLKGRRVSVGSPGSTSPITEIFLYGANVTFDDIKVEYLGFNQSVQAMKDGKIEAAQLSGGIPHPAVLDLFSSKTKVKLISVKPEESERIINNYPYVNSFTIPARTYPNQDYEVQTTAVTTILAVRKDIDDDIVYLLTKAIFENIDELSNTYNGFRGLSLETAFKGFKVPLHSGAIRYYKEVGLEIPESVIQ